MLEGDAAGDPIVRLDESLAASLHAHATPAITTVVSAVTRLGDTSVLVAVAALAAAWLAGRSAYREAVFVLGALGGAELLTWTLKDVFARERPVFDDPVATASSFSFPSGHALVATAVYGALACLAVSALRSRQACVACLAMAALLVAAIGASRLYLGVHYLSDVVAGFSVGLAWLLVSFAALRTRRALHAALAPAAAAVFMLVAASYI